MKPAPWFTLFNTPIGECGLVWRDTGICALIMPEGGPEQTRARLLHRHPDAQPAASLPQTIADTIGELLQVLQGADHDLAQARLDMDGQPPFHRRVWEITRRIRPGSTLTYGEIARLLGEPGAARAVGRALGSNPYPLIVPCHRVLAANGRSGGFSAPGGIDTKMRLLQIEGAQARGNATLFADLP